MTRTWIMLLMTIGAILFGVANLTAARPEIALSPREMREWIVLVSDDALGEEGLRIRIASNGE